MKNWLTGKDPDAGKDWRQEEKGTTEDEWLDGVPDSMDMSSSRLQELVMDGEAWFAVCSPRGHKESDMTEQLNWTKLKKKSIVHLATSSQLKKKKKKVLTWKARLIAIKNKY